MPSPIIALQRPDLGAIAFEYALEASQRGFIGTKLMPIFRTPLKQGDYPKIPTEALLKSPDTSRSPRGNYNRSDYQFETGTYNCKENGWEELIDDSERNNYARLFDVEEVATKRAVDIILRGQEARIAARLMNTTNIPNTAGVTNEWDDAANATPLADVTLGKRNMRAVGGLMPNVGACSLKVFENVLITKEIKDAFKYTNPVEIGGFEAQRRTLAMYFGLDEIIVGGAVKDSAKKGQGTVISDLWDDEYFLLAKISDGGPDLREASLGRTMLWEEDSPDNLVTESYRDEAARSDVVRVRQNTDDAVFTFTNAGYLLSNITA